MRLRFARPLLVPVLLLAGLVAFPACDSSDPVESVQPAEVAGVYNFLRFRFNPDPAFVPDVVVLDTLVEDRTSIELLDSGQFQLRYRLEGGLDNIINGSFTLDAQRVTLAFEPNNEARLAALLLDPTLRFTRSNSEELTLSTTKRVDLEAYSADYRNTGLDLTNVPGRLEIDLRRLGR